MPPRLVPAAGAGVLRLPHTCSRGRPLPSGQRDSVGKRRRTGQTDKNHPPPRAPHQRPEGRGTSFSTPGADGAGRPPGSGRRTWLETHGRDLRFLLLFALFLGIFYLASVTSFAKDRLFPSYLKLNARAAVPILNSLGQNVHADGHSLITPATPSSQAWSIVIERGCDAIEPSALFCAAVLASPVPLLSRLGAVLVGTVVLMALNFVRIVSLFLVGRYFRSAFDIVHLDVWQAVFIFLAILFWALWASRATRKRPQAAHAVA